MTFVDYLDFSELSSELIEWCSDPRHQRFGQYICNKYLESGASAPNIFYEEDSLKAYGMIIDVLLRERD